ncbi:membrane protein of unknown function, partial [uncultured Woeseiaceae bacterium]
MSDSPKQNYEKKEAPLCTITEGGEKSLSNSILYLLQMGVVNIFPLISIPIITNRLSLAEYGIFALVQVYATIAIGIVNFGMTTGYERNYFVYEECPEKLGALLSTVAAFVAFTTSLLILITFLWGSKISILLFGQEQYRELLTLVLVSSGLTNLTNYYLFYLKNKGLAGSYSKIAISKSLLNFTFMLLLLLYFDLGLISLGYAMFGSSLIVSLFSLYRKITDTKNILNKLLLYDVLKISLPLTPKILFGSLGTQFDKMMLGMLSAFGGVAVYSIGQKISYLVFQFMTALDLVFIPGVYRRLFVGEDKEAREDNESNLSVGSYLTPFAYISIFFALQFVLFSEELFFLLLPETYADGVIIVVIFSVYYANMFFGKIAGTQLIYAKKSHITSLLTLVGIVLNVSMNIPMIIKWGIYGAAWATFISGMVMTVLFYRVAQHYIKVDWEWKPMGFMYGLIVIATIFVLVFYLDFVVAPYWIVLGCKVLIVCIYLYGGTKIGVVTRSNLSHSYLT